MTNPVPEHCVDAPGWAAELDAVSFRYRSGTLAIDDLTVTFRPDVITGLLGRNGSGKTTLSRLLAAQSRPRSGRVLVDGADPWEDDERMAGTVLVSADMRLFDDEPLRETLALWSHTRPGWDQDLAERLLDLWGLDPRRNRPESLSRGQRSAFCAVLGLAARAPLTIFDEVHLGMDAVVRRQFTDTLLETYTARPRTIILSSHLIEEVADLLEDVVLLHRGRLLDAGGVDQVRDRHRRLDGTLPDLTDVLIRLTEEAS